MITVGVSGDLTLRQQLRYLSLPRAKRRKMNRRLGRQVITLSRKRVTAQKGVDGQPWERRKNGRGKMLKRLMKGQNVRLYVNDQNGKITWPNAMMGKIARRHQEGIPETVTASDMAKRYGEPDYTGAATPEQAKSLVKEGFRVYAGKRKNGRVKTRKASQKWIRENMTLGQAGLVLRLLREAQRKTQWEIPVPERSFLGVSATDKQQLADDFFQQLMSDIR
ncbi:phage virion morphogenesis protein [uncultured Amphritea sp.]|uniref:phage virion morphogenesis protein n=1 Tax=uncultured Amphritea sp. TaxID=981605 RepID=UPI0025FE0C2C|nr:phage virion morphogenesis protein [uncultured Amphritea sp.]